MFFHSGYKIVQVGSGSAEPAGSVIKWPPGSVSNNYGSGNTACLYSTVQCAYDDVHIHTSPTVWYTIYLCYAKYNMHGLLKIAGKDAEKLFAKQEGSR
jgi:hypothetical protein